MSSDPEMPANPSPFRISVVTFPGGGLSLERDIELVKPALIYGDVVVLESPIATLLADAAGLTQLPDAERARFLKGVLPALNPERASQLVANLDGFERLRTRRYPSRGELVQRLQYQRALNQTWEDLRARVNDMLEQAGVPQLDRAMREGLLMVRPIALRQNAFAESFLEGLGQSLADPSTYPLVDPEMGNLVALSIDAGKLTIPTSTTSRAKQAAFASGLLSNLPTFPGATLDEILDIRAALAEFLGPFRASMVTFARECEALPFDPDFAGHVRDRWVESVAPALEAINQGISENSGLRSWPRSALKSGLMGAAAGAAIAIVAHPGAIGEVLTAAGGVSIDLARTTYERHQAMAQVRRDGVYLLYETDRLLTPA